MNAPRRRWLLPISFVVTLGAAVPPAFADQTVFALSDSTGKKLLALDTPTQPAALARALCRDRPAVGVRYAGARAGDPKRDTGRQTADNWEFMAGHVYEVVSGAVPVDAVCLLGDAAYLASRDVLTIASEASSCAPAVEQGIAALRQRALTGCWPVAELGEGRALLAVQFERRGDDVLAALVLVQGGTLSLHDLPGDASDESSTWRVDDGGQFDADDFDLLMALRDRTSGAVDLVVAWRAPEGASLMLLRGQGARLEQKLSSYRYWSP